MNVCYARFFVFFFKKNYIYTAQYSNLRVAAIEDNLFPDILLKDKLESINYLKKIYEIFKRQYQWFRSTQWGEIEEWGRQSSGNEAYRWRGRTDHHTLTSG